jgi:hypothetical protein
MSCATIVRPIGSGTLPSLATGMASVAVQSANHTMLPKPPRSHGIVSKSTVTAATRAITGMAMRRKGDSSGQSRTWVSSATRNWAITANTASTPTIEPRTARLLAVLPRV